MTLDTTFVIRIYPVLYRSSSYSTYVACLGVDDAVCGRRFHSSVFQFFRPWFNVLCFVCGVLCVACCIVCCVLCVRPLVLVLL